MVKSEAIDTAKPSGVTSSQTALRGHRPLAYRALQYDSMRVREEKVLTQAAKFNSLLDHFINKIARTPRTRLKRTSFLKESKELAKENLELDDQIPEPLPQASTIPPWQELSLNIITTIPGIENKDTQPQHVRKCIASDYIESYYNAESWTEVYTDGSATEATKDGRAGVFIKLIY